MEITLLVFLVILNAAFAMSEMALSASRRVRLQVLVEAGAPGAQAALALHADPTKFLSTVQIGITSIGILNGIVGEAAFSAPLAAWLVAAVGLPEGAAGYAATALVVLLITVVTIIFGELVPKRLGQLYPETISRLVARPMNALSAAARPLVAVLSIATQAVLRLVGIREVARHVTEEEIAASLEEGVDAGVIEAQEHQMVRNVFRLDDRQIGSIMIPRAEIVWLDLAAPVADTLARVIAGGHSRYPVCRGSLDDVQGVLGVQRLLAPLARGATPRLEEHLQTPVFVPETLSGMELLEHFRDSNAELVFVVDEYGAVQGVISDHDLLEAITGEFSAAAGEEAWATERADGSWLIDGLMPVTELKDRLAIKELPDEELSLYNTLAGMIIVLLGRLPHVADTVLWSGWCFEVVDLDDKRIDKVLASRVEFSGEPS